MITPIETYYNGYRFRSRLEARWAVFFDACKCEYEYEPEGFDLGDGTYYLPDFLLHNIEYCGEYGSCNIQNLYVEVKGVMTPFDAKRLSNFLNELSDGSGSLFIVSALPKWNEKKTDFDVKYQWFNIPDEEGIGIFDAYTLLQTIPGNLISSDEVFTFPNEATFILGEDGLGIMSKQAREICRYEHYWTVAALEKATQARFEHGESPVVY